MSSAQIAQNHWCRRKCWSIYKRTTFNCLGAHHGCKQPSPKCVCRLEWVSEEILELAAFEINCYAAHWSLFALFHTHAHTHRGNSGSSSRAHALCCVAHTWRRNMKHCHRCSRYWLFCACVYASPIIDRLIDCRRFGFLGDWPPWNIYPLWSSLRNATGVTRNGSERNIRLLNCCERTSENEKNLVQVWECSHTQIWVI